MYSKFNCFVDCVQRACESYPWSASVALSPRIHFRNTAMFPEKDPDNVFPADQYPHPCAIACHGFSTSWNALALIPCEDLAALDSPEPVAMSSIPAVRIPAMKYRSFMHGLEKLNAGR